MRANSSGPLLPDPQEGEEGPLDERSQDKGPDDEGKENGDGQFSLLGFLCAMDD